MDRGMSVYRNPILETLPLESVRDLPRYEVKAKRFKDMRKH
jgi:hypothetical protein